MGTDREGSTLQVLCDVASRMQMGQQDSDKNDDSHLSYFLKNFFNIVT